MKEEGQHLTAEGARGRAACWPPDPEEMKEVGGVRVCFAGRRARWSLLEEQPGGISTSQCGQGNGLRRRKLPESLLNKNFARLITSEDHWQL